MFLFMPIACTGYFLLSSRFPNIAKSWLVLASLCFYGWWNVYYVPLIIISAIFNYLVGTYLGNLTHGTTKSRIALKIGIVANLLALGYFKYIDFITDNIMSLAGIAHEPFNVVLPLAISFFTFQQIAYLVDSYRRETSEYNFRNYMLFVCFFPQLIAGPIVHHKQMMPQFADPKNLKINDHNLTLGLLIFSIGLFKKIVLADTFALWATSGFDEAIALSFLEAWATSLSYTFQLYFDFSGYTDMAIGAALILNIKLPFNFNSPYKAKSIREFWQRWHITLSSFLRDYLYISMGGSRCPKIKLYRNLFLTFLLGGLWHGAAWTFVIWGALHGAAMVIHRIYSSVYKELPAAIAWVITFLFVNATWVVFRAKDWASAQKIYQGMLDINSFEMINYLWLAAVIAGLLIVLSLPNSNRLQEIELKRIPYELIAVFSAGLIFGTILIMEIRKTSEFLYFQF